MKGVLMSSATTLKMSGLTGLATHPAWPALKADVQTLRGYQRPDGSIDLDVCHRGLAVDLSERITVGISAFARDDRLAHDVDYLSALIVDLRRWAADGFGIPDFLDSLLAFAPQTNRAEGVEHLVLFPMYTQNGNPDRLLEALLIRVVWPEWVAQVEAQSYSNDKFLPVAFTDFTPGYDTHSAVLFPETVAVREVPTFSWGAIFCDREAARFRTVIGAAVEVMHVELPGDADLLLHDQGLAEETFVLWDLVHDRSHSRGDLPFDPFMIKQRMPFWLYALEELRCDLTALRAAVALEQEGVERAKLAQYAIILDRAFRFPLSGSRVRNYDGLGGQLLFAYLRRNGAMSWTDNRLTIDWERVPEVALALLAQIEELYWRSIDRPKVAHWIAAYELVSSYVEPHPASRWAHDRSNLPWEGATKELTDAVMSDEFPLSMFFESLSKKMGSVIESVKGIRA